MYRMGMHRVYDGPNKGNEADNKRFTFTTFAVFVLSLAALLAITFALYG